MIPGIVGAATGGLLNIAGGLFQQQGQQQEIQQQENFQTQMSNTAYQRSMADMTKAGLNPGLMYGSGGAESAPQGASMTPPNVLGGASDAAINALQAQKSMAVQDSTIDLNRANTLGALNKADISGVEAGLFKTGQTLLQGIEDKVKNWGQTNASSSGIDKILAFLQSKSSAPDNGVPQLGDAPHQSGFNLMVEPGDQHHQGSDW